MLVLIHLEATFCSCSRCPLNSTTTSVLHASRNVSQSTQGLLPVAILADMHCVLRKPP